MAAGCAEACGDDPQQQRRRGPEVIVVSELVPWPQDLRDGSGAIRPDPGLTNPEIAHVATALEPGVAQEFIERGKGRPRLELELHPVVGVPSPLDGDMEGGGRAGRPARACGEMA